MRPAPHLGQRQAVVGRARGLEVGGPLEGGEGDADVAPAREVVGEVVVEALGGVRARVRAVVEDLGLVEEPAVRAVEPEAEPVGAAPVLRPRGAGGREVHAEAAEVADRELRREHGVGPDLARPGQGLAFATTGVAVDTALAPPLKTKKPAGAPPSKVAVVGEAALAGAANAREAATVASHRRAWNETRGRVMGGSSGKVRPDGMPDRARTSNLGRG